MDREESRKSSQISKNDVCYWEINEYFVIQILNIMQIRNCNVTRPLFFRYQSFKMSDCKWKISATRLVI